MLLNVMPFAARDFAVDLGTANTVVFAPGRGIVVDEPSIVAINTQSDKTEAVGHAAHAMLGRTPANITTVRPLRDGVIADFEAAERLLSYLLRKAQGSVTWRRTRLVIGIPSSITQVERRAVIDSAYRAKASEVHLVDEPMAAAIGAGLPITEATGSMVVDIGGGTTDIAVISLGGVVYSSAIRTAGNHMDDAIIGFMRRRHGLLIGERTAENVKIHLGSACPGEPVRDMEVRGRCLREGRPRIVEVHDADVRDALAEPLRAIVAAVRNALESLPPEIAADVSDQGMTLTGGGALLTRLDERLRLETGVPVQVAADPLTSVVQGAGRMLADAALLRRVAWSS
ncbi:MAG TPA: rod shape-determining protein [Vicinamibacterales bacterium]|nr:rod shape-determining protein [Vicinamibacterales bacterium]